MRGAPDPQLAMLTTLSTEELIPPDHPIRKIHVVVDAVLDELDAVFEGMYASSGRTSVQDRGAVESDGVDGNVLDPLRAGVIAGD